MDIGAIDWNEVWRDIQTRKEQHRLQDSSFWDGRAKDFTRAVTRTDYIKQFIEIFDPQPEWSVLDIGAAAGTLALPLAERTKQITAVEPSARMREFLQERRDALGLENIDIVEGRWEDDWEALGIEPHDAVIASRSLMMHDLREAIEKVERFARRRVILSTLVGEGPHDEKIFQAVGREAFHGPDYIVVYNLLRQMDIFANVAFTRNCEAKNWASLDEAVEGHRWMLHDMSADEEARLREHLAATLVPENGRLKMPYAKVVRWAVIWWDKDSEC